jgi:hypothetical protein
MVMFALILLIVDFVPFFCIFSGIYNITCYKNKNNTKILIKTNRTRYSYKKV